MSHTKEPWSLGSSDLPVSSLSIHGGSRKHTTIARFTPTEVMPETIANARRIVACVNACATISTENLESMDSVVGAVMKQADAEIKKVKQQRDELLAALESLIDMDVAYKRGPKVELAVESAKDVIAKVKGGA